jgi:hypothetical protein
MNIDNTNIKLPINIRYYNNTYKQILINFNDTTYKKIYELSNSKCIRCNINNIIKIKKCINGINNKNNQNIDYDTNNKNNQNIDYDTNNKNNQNIDYDITHSCLLCKHQHCGRCQSYGHSEIVCRYLVEN